jgi:flagellar FliJ protein
MAGFKLAAVLRARQAQEDAAKAAVVRARADAEMLASRARSIERDLDGRPLPGTSSAAAFTATLSARNALAGALNDAIGAARLADGAVQERLDELTDAAVQRRTIEKLEERHKAARRHKEDKADELAVDDLTTAAQSRRTEEPEP